MKKYLHAFKKGAWYVCKQVAAGLLLILAFGIAVLIVKQLYYFTLWLWFIW